MNYAIIDTEFTRNGNIYDFAAVFMDEDGNELDSMRVLIRETLQDVSAMRSSYYNHKLPSYLASLASDNIQIVSWETCQQKFKACCAAWGVNTAYTYHLSADKPKCDRMSGGEFMPETFEWRDIEDIAKRTICTRASYLMFCIENGFVSEKTGYASCSAETVLKYLRGVDYVEEHTALSDARDEFTILQACRQMQTANARQEVNSEQDILTALFNRL